MIKEYFFSDKGSLFSSLAEETNKIIGAAIDENKAATMLVSGGSTPQPLYQKLSTLELDWQKVNVALVDERWVGIDHEASNEAFIRNNLLVNNARDAKLTAMKTNMATASSSCSSCEKHYRQLSQPFDFTILGMGPDGHTASLFPKARGLDEALYTKENLCVAIDAEPSEVTGLFTERMSLSLHGLLLSRQIHLLITGEEKLAVYKKALLGEDLTSSPITAVLQQNNVPVNVYWAP